MPVNKKIELSEEEFNRFFKRVEPVEEGKTPAQYNEPLDITKIDDTAFKKIAKDLGLDSEQMKSERESRDVARKNKAEFFVKRQKDARDEARKKRRDDFKRSAEDKEKQLKGEKAKFDEKFGKIYDIIRAVNSAALKRDALQKSFANPNLDLDDKDEVQIVESNTINQENLDKSRGLLREAEIFFRENKDKIENLMSSLTGLISAIEGVNYKQEEDVFRKDLRRRYADFEKAENELGQLFNQSNKKFKDVCEKMRIALDDLFNNFTRFIEFTGIQGKIDKEESKKEGLEGAVKASVAVINRITGGSLSREAVISDSLDNVLGVDYDNPEINKIRGERYLFKSNRSSEDLKYSLLRDYQMMSSIYKKRIIRTKNISNSLDSLDVFERERKNYLDYFERILTLSYESGFLGDKYLDFLQKYQNLRDESPKQNDDLYLRVRLARLGEFDLEDEDWEKLREEYIIPFLEIDTKLLKLAKEIIIAFNNNIDKYNQEQEEKFSNDFASSFGGQMPEFFRKELEEKKKEQSEGRTGNELKRVQDKYNKLIEHVNVLKTTKKIKETEKQIEKLKEELKKLEETKKSIEDEKNIIARRCGVRGAPPLPESEETKLKRELNTKEGEVDGLNEKLTQQKDRADRAERDRAAAVQDAQQEKQKLEDALASAQESEREKEVAVREKDQTQQELDEKTEELQQKTTDLKDLRLRLIQHLSTLQEKRREIKDLEGELGRLRQEKEAEREQLESELAEKEEELTTAYRAYNARLTQLKEELQQHQLETERLRKEATKLRWKNALSSVSYKNINQKLDEEKRKRNELQNELRRITDENQTLSQTNLVNERAFAQEKEAHERVRERNRETEKLNEQLRRELESRTASSAEEISRITQEKETISQELEEARREHESALQKLETPDLSREETEKINQRLEQEKEVLERQRDDTDELIERLAMLEGERDQERSELESRLQEKEAERGQLESQLQEKEAERGQLESQLQEKEAEEKTLMNSYASSQQKLVDQILGLQNDINVLTRKNRDNEGAKKQLERLQEEKANGEKNFRVQIKRLEREKSGIERSLRTSEGKRAELERSLKTSEGKRAELQRTSEQEKRELQGRLTTSEGEKVELERSLRTSEGKRAKLERSLRTSEKNISEIEQTNSNLLGTIERIESKLSRRSDLTPEQVQTLRGEKERLEQEKERLEQEKEGLEQEKERLEQEKEGYKNYSRILEQEREENLGTIGERDDSVRQLNRRLEEEREGHSQRIRVLEGTINDLKNLLDEKQTQLEFFESTVGGLQEKLSREEGVVSWYENKTKELQEDLERRGEDNEKLQDENLKLREELSRRDTEEETTFSSPLKLRRPKQLSPMSKIKNMRNSRRMAVEKLKY